MSLSRLHLTQDPITPDRWMRTFAHPGHSSDAARVRHGSRADTHVFGGNEDALPTWFHPCTPSRDFDEVVAKDEFETHTVSEPPLVVSAKRKRRNGRKEAPLVACASERLSATCSSTASPTQRRTRATRPRTRSTSAMRRSDHDHDRDDDQGPTPSQLLTSPTRPRSRLVLEAVEIVRKKRSYPVRRSSRDRHPTESPRKLASAFYPSPPASRVGITAAAHGNSHLITDLKEHSSSNPILPMKTSKYFARGFTPLTPSTPERMVPTSSSSLIPTIPVYTESSDFENPQSGASVRVVMDGLLDGGGHSLSWHANPDLSRDLTIMLRRLKPILVQESVRDDPWKVLIAVRLLNVTSGHAAIPVFCKIVSRWPAPQDLVRAPLEELIELLKPIGLYNKRASWLKHMSEYFLTDREDRKIPLAALLSKESPVSDVPPFPCPGVGPYALDSLRIFCAEDKDAWKQVMPRDKELVRYLRWRWAVEEGKVWYPGGIGVIGDVDIPYLITLVDELATHYDEAIGGEGYMYHFCNDLRDVLTGNTTEQHISVT